MSKICYACKLPLDESCFHKCSNSKDGLQSKCKECNSKLAMRPDQKAKRTEYASLRWKSGVLRDQRYKKNFGITLEDYDRMFAKQKGVCEICGSPQEKRSSGRGGVVTNLAVDHCHKSGKVRGLLCGKCNSFIGFAEDSKQRLEKAIEYLKFHEIQTTIGEPNGQA